MQVQLEADEDGYQGDREHDQGVDVEGVCDCSEVASDGALQACKLAMAQEDPP